MKKRYVVILTVMLWSAGFVFVLGSAAPVSALQLEWNKSIGKTVQTSYEHKDRDVASKTTGVELFYQGPFYQRCDEEEYERANEQDSSITLSNIANLPTVEDKTDYESDNFVLVLTLTSLEDLKAEDFPDEWIDSLKSLTGQEFEGEESFLAAVEEKIGQALPDPDKELILEHALIRQADSTATSTVVETSNSDQTQFHFEINLDDVIGNSYYNKTTNRPSHHDKDYEDYAKYSDPDHPDYDPSLIAKYFPGEFVDGVDTFPDYSQVRDPGSNPDGVLAYYNNWEMTSADSYAYGGYDNTFAIDDGDSIADEQFWVTAIYSYEYDLSGRWTYHTVENDDGVIYNERTGHFYTSFGSYLNIDVDGFEPPNPPEGNKCELSRNDIADIPNEGLERVSQEMSGEFTTTYSFLVTEGIDYSFDMWAGVYGYCDGFADYNSFGLATLDLMITEDMPHTPEPATILLLAIGIPGLYWYHKRFHKR